MRALQLCFAVVLHSAVGVLSLGVGFAGAQQSGIHQETLIYEAPPDLDPDLSRVLPGLAVRYMRWWTFWGSPDGKRVAVPLKRDGKWSLFGPGIAPAEYDEIQATVFSPDGSRTAVIAKRGNWRVIVDGVEGPQYDEISQLLFSPDSKRLVYAGKQGEKWKVLEDGRERGEHRNVKGLTFSRDGTRFAYAAQNENGWVVVGDVSEGPASDDVIGPRFSADGKHLVYAARKADGWSIFMDGREGPLFKNVAWWNSSPDGARVAYLAEPFRIESRPSVSYFSKVDAWNDKRRFPERAFVLADHTVKSWWVPVIDGVNGATAPVMMGPVFDTTGTRVIHLAGDHLAVGIYVNRKKVADIINEFPPPSPPGVILLQDFAVWGDASRIAVVSQTRGSPENWWRPVFEGFHRVAMVELGAGGDQSNVRAGPFHKTGRVGALSNLRFSPNGRHFGYEVIEGNPPVYRVVVNERPGPDYEQILRYSLRVTNDSIRYVARRGRQFLRVTQALPAQ